MTDLDITKLCAKAMGIDLAEIARDQAYAAKQRREGIQCEVRHFDPLHDDAQAMALVKKFGLTIITELGQGREMWRVHHWRESGHSYHHDLNRAIATCIAKMQAAK